MIERKPRKKPQMFVFNGPPRCGKDTAHNVDIDTLPRGYVYFRERFSRPLKAGVLAIYNISGDIAAHLERTKDLKTPILLGETYRQAQIALFNHLAMEHGQSVLGEMLLTRLQYDWLMDVKLVVLCPDGGREPEIKPLINDFDVHIVQIMREGTNFDNDIRGYIEPPGCTVTQIENNGTVEDLQERVRRYITAVLSQ